MNYIRVHFHSIENFQKEQWEWIKEYCDYKLPYPNEAYKNNTPKSVFLNERDAILFALKWS
jgi:hypothetical protein